VRKKKIDENRVKGLQRYDGVAFIENLTQIDQPDTKTAGKWCPDGLFLDGGPDVVRFGERLQVFCFGFVEIGL